MTIRTKTAHVARIAEKTFVLGGLLLVAAGCVSASSGRSGYYDDSSSYTAPAGSTVVAPPGSTVIINNDRTTTARQVPDYDNKWDYGRIGNGNYHGTQDDDVHNY